jgi:two-component system, OmpR family, sensor histidine kinase BaeS
MRGPKGRPSRPPLGLAWRLFAAMGLVVIAGAGTMLVTVLLVAWPTFHTQLIKLRPPISAREHASIDDAFGAAGLLATSVGVTVALAVALVVTWLVARRLAAPVAEAGEAARRIADGDYETRLPQPRIGPEFDALTEAFNTMTHRLANTERTRRRLLTDLAHELRTPLASIEATIEAVADGILPADQSTLATLAEQSQRLHRLVGDLSAVSRAEERQLNLNPVLVPLKAVVSTAVASARPLFEARGTTLTEDCRSPSQVLVDPDRLAEALGALLDNALRHTSKGGTVTVATATQDDRCRILVSDNGEGFEPAVASRLFERFYRGDSSRTASSAGSGIGLTIARAIVTAHNGQLVGRSDGPGTGAEFEITLPIAGRRR